MKIEAIRYSPKRVPDNHGHSNKRQVDLNSLKQLSIRFYEDEDGVTAIEYGLIAALFVIACLSAIKGVGVSLSNVFWHNIQGELDSALGS